MNQSYRPALRSDSVFGSGQPELRPHNGLMNTSFGNQCNIVKRGHDQSGQLASSSLKQPSVLGFNQFNGSHCFSPLRLPDLNTVVNRTDLQHKNQLHCASPISDEDEFEAPSVQLPPSPDIHDLEPFESLQDVQTNGFSDSPHSLERCSPISNGFLHFGSTLFDSGDFKDDEVGEHSSNEDFNPFSFSPKLTEDCLVTDTKNTCSSGAEKRTFKPIFNLMSKTISELNPTLSPSALPEIIMRDGWSEGKEAVSEEVSSPVHEGSQVSLGATSNPNSPVKDTLSSVELSEGDVVWAKFNKRPWWPSQITRHPAQKVHTKMKVPSPRPCRMYFVQRIGDVVESAWIPESVVIPFESGHQLEDSLVLKRKGKRKEKDYKYKIPKHFQSAWEISVSKAEELLHGENESALPTSPFAHILPPSPELQSVGQRLSQDQTLSSSSVEHSENKKPHNKLSLQNGRKNNVFKKKKKRLSDIFGHIVGSSKDQHFSTTYALEDEPKDSPYADLDSVPILHRPKRTEISPEHHSDPSFVTQHDSPTVNQTHPIACSDSSSLPLTSQSEEKSGSLNEMARTKRSQSSPSKTCLIAKALGVEKATDFDALSTKPTSAEIDTEPSPVKSTTDASIVNETSQTRESLGKSSSSETPKRRSRKPDKKKIHNGRCKESKSEICTNEPMPDVTVKKENVTVEIATSPPSSHREAVQDVKEVKFQSLVEDEVKDTDGNAFKPEPNYQFSTYLMLLKDMHDTREKEGKPLTLPPSPVVIKEEPMVIPTTAAGAQAKSPAESSTQNATENTPEHNQSSPNKPIDVVNRDTIIREEAPSPSGSEKQRRKQRLPAKLQVSIPRLSAELANLAYAKYLSGSPTRLGDETTAALWKSTSVPSKRVSEEEKPNENGHADSKLEPKVNGSHTEFDQNNLASKPLPEKRKRGRPCKRRRKPIKRPMASSEEFEPVFTSEKKSKLLESSDVAAAHEADASVSPSPAAPVVAPEAPEDKDTTQPQQEETPETLCTPSVIAQPSLDTPATAETNLPPNPESALSPRKRPRKASHQVLECTIEEVSFSPTKRAKQKRVSQVTSELKKIEKNKEVKTVKTTPQKSQPEQKSIPVQERPSSPRRSKPPKPKPERESEEETTVTTGSLTSKEEVNDSLSSQGDVKGKLGAAALKENVCQICEKPGDLLNCDGNCYGAFHLQCIGLSSAPKEPFLCAECKTGAHACFVCKESHDAVKRCMIPLCGKFYHTDCIMAFSATQTNNKGLRCSLHVCLSCHIANPLNLCNSKGRLLKCVRCPVAYHANDNCMAAGSIMLANNSFLCPNHFTPRKGCKNHEHINVSWCFVCSEGLKSENF